METADQMETQVPAETRPWYSPRRPWSWLMGLFLLYVLLGFFVAPRVVIHLATAEVEKLGRELIIGTVEINPVLLTIRATDTELRDTDGAVLFSFDEYFWDFQASSLFRWAWTFKEIRLSGLLLNWERFTPGDDRFGRLMDSFPGEEAVAESSGSTGMPRLLIHRFQLIDGKLDVIDRLPEGDFETQLGPVTVDIAGLSTLPDDSGQQQVQILTRGGGEISWQGSLQLSPLKSAGNLKIAGKGLQDLGQYLNLLLPIDVSGDSVSISFDYHVEQPEGGELAAEVSGLQAEMDGWSFTLDGEEQPFVTLPVIALNGGGLRWPQMEVALDQVELRDASLDVISDSEGVLNLDRVAMAIEEYLASTEEASAPDTAAGSTGAELSISLAEFRISNASVDYHDQAVGPTANVSVRDMNVKLTGINNEPGSEFPTEASFGLESGGSGRFVGRVVALPEVDIAGELTAEDMALTVAQPWVERQARVLINEGRMKLQGEVALNPQQPGSFLGSAEILDLDVTDQVHQSRLTGWESMKISRVEVDLAAATAMTSEVRLQQPYGRLQIAADQTTNIDELLIEQPADTAPGDVESNEAELAITVGGIVIEDAALDFSDESLPLPFATEIRQLSGTVSTLATGSEAPAELDLEGQVNEYGLARIDGSINAWDPFTFTDVQMVFRNIEMERMTPYSIEFAGWEIASGRLDLDLDYKISQGQLQGANDIVLREFTVGDKVETGGPSLPLKFAVALLKDSEGVIDVDVPVTGDLNDPEIGVGSIVWKAVVNLLTKAVTAPFRLLGSLVGVESEDFGTLSFEPGSAEVSPPDREKLVKLAEAMGQRPELTLEVGGVFAPEQDAQALREAAVEARIQAGVEASSEQLTTAARRQVTEQLFSERHADTDLVALQAEFTSKPGEQDENAEAVLDETAYVAELRRRLVESEALPEESLRQLAEQRAEAVTAALVAGDSQTQPALTRIDSVEVEPAESGEVPLELKVQVGDS